LIFKKYFDIIYVQCEKDYLKTSDVKIKILIIEHNSGLVSTLEAQLKENKNFEVCARIKSVEELGNAYKSSNPDIILFDLETDNEAYFDFLKSIDSQIASGKIAIIAFAPTSDFNKIRKAMKAGCSDFLMLPVKSDELLTSLNAAHEKVLQSRKAASTSAGGPLARTPAGKIITIFSTKGGVGKSTLAVNMSVMLALFLKNKGRRIALIDANFQFGDIGFMLNLKPTKTIYELVKEMGEPSTVPIELLENFVTKHESGLDVLLAPSKPQFAEEIKMLHLRYILECFKKNYDYIIIDTSNLITETELTIFDWTAALFIVATLEITTIKNLVLTFEILKDLQIPKDNIFLILNRAFQKMGIDTAIVEEKLIKISCQIPSDGERVVSSLNNGCPFVTDLKLDVPIVKAIFDFVSFTVTPEDRDLLNMTELPPQAKANVFDFFKNFMKK